MSLLYQCMLSNRVVLASSTSVATCVRLGWPQVLTLYSHKIIFSERKTLRKYGGSTRGVRPYLACCGAVRRCAAVERPTRISGRQQGGKRYGSSTLESHDAVEAVPGTLEPLHGDGVVAR